MASPSKAACPTHVLNGETQTTTQILLDGETCEIASGGIVDVTTANGVTADHDAVILNNGTINFTSTFHAGIFAEGLSLVTNNGIISGTGPDALAMGSNHESTLVNNGTLTIDSDGGGGMLNYDDGTITNNGTIDVQGFDAFGIFADENNMITNDGSIAVVGTDSNGILVEDRNTIINNGSLIMSGDGAEGIETDGSFNSVQNLGTITTTGYLADAIDLDGNQNFASNAGTITTNGDESEGIDGGNGDTIVNTGTIILNGDDSFGIDGNSDNLITNAGKIHGSLSSGGAILLEGDDNTLTLQPGSILTGTITFDASTNQYVVENGLSVINTFTTNLPQSTDPNGAPMSISGMQVAVMDPTNLAAIDDYFLDITAGVSKALQEHLGDVRGKGVNEGASVLGYAAAKKEHGAFQQILTDGAPQTWGTTFGSLARLSAGHATTGATTISGGLILGAKNQISEQLDAGAFVAANLGQIAADHDSQTSNISTILAGVHASTDIGTSRLGIAGIVGGAHFDRKRNIANNTVAGGVEQAAASYYGLYFAPEISLHKPIKTANFDIFNSTSVKYLGIFLNGFSESGGSDNLTIDDRNLHLLEVSSAFTLPTTFTHDGGDTTDFDLNIGAKVHTRVGDSTISGTLLSNAISFDPYDAKTVGTAFAGVDAKHSLASGGDLHFRSQVHIDTNMNFGLDTLVGFKFELN